MKKKLAGLLILLLLVLTMPVLAEVSIDQNHFPDQAFRIIVREFDLDKNSILSDAEIAEARVIDLTDEKAASLLAEWPLGVTSFDGIEYLTALTELNCSSRKTGWSTGGITGTGSHLTTLDLSMNKSLEELKCYGNRLNRLILGYKPFLSHLDCHDNCLSELDLSGCTALRDVYCYRNRLETLQTGDNPGLQHLDCAYNQLTALDIAGNTGLHTLACNDNCLSMLDLSRCESLQQLECYRNRLYTLNISAENRALTRINCSDNHLSSLSVSSQPLLKVFCIDNNNLTELDVTKNASLKELSCRDNKLTELNLGSSTNLEKLDCSHNRLENLILGNNNLVRLFCGYNRLTSLNLIKNPDLQELQCQSNSLTSLDITRNTKLTVCVCFDNQLEKLDLSKNSAITILETYGNKIQNLDVTACKQINDYLSDVKHTDTSAEQTDDGHLFSPLGFKEDGLAMILTFDPYTEIKAYHFVISPQQKIYTITVYSDGNGKAYASTEIGQKDDTVFLFAEPEPGYKLKEWQVKSGNVSIIDNYFKLGIDDVEIQAVFVPKGE